MRFFAYNQKMGTNIYRIALFIVLLGTMMVSFAQQKHSAPAIEITIQGLKGRALKNVMTQLNLKKDLITTTQPNIVRWHFFKMVPKETLSALKPFGYFKAKVNTKLSIKNKTWFLSVNIRPGPRLKFTAVNVSILGQGKSDKQFQYYLKHLPIKPGDNFNSEKYEEIKETLQNFANNRGYFHAKMVNSRLIINLSNYTSSVFIVYNTGPRFRFGKTYFSPSPIRESLLKKYLTYKPEEYYWDRQLEESRINLNDTPYFQQVTMTPLLNQARNELIPIGVDLYPEDQVLYSFGLGYGTNTGIRGLASTDIRYVNSRGHTMKFIVRGSQRNNQLAGTYTIPGANPSRDTFAITGGLLSMNQPTGNGNSAQVNANYTTKLAGWQLSAGLTYLVEKYQLTNYPASGINTNTNTSLLYPSLSLQKTVAKDDFINPDRGFKVALNLNFASESVGSKTSFSQYRIDTKFLYTLTWTHTRLLARASFGATSIKKLESLPLSLQFFAGGADSIRGYIFNSIGPGRYLAVGSFEIQQRVYKKFYLAGFIDAGNVSNNIFKQTPFIGSGPALVYLTPIGPFEISVAKAIGPFHNGWKVQFSMGAVL